MLGTAVIVFREVLEAALIIGLMLAITRGVQGRLRLAAGGIVAGCLGAVVLALVAGHISSLAEGVGTELLNAGILGAAVLMLAWHVVWMRRHSQVMTQQIRQTGAGILEGKKPPVIIAVIIGIAILREGSEVVLLMYGVSAAGSGALGMFGGGLIGLAAGIVLGMVMYFGLARVPLSSLFRVSGWLLILLAAGLAAQASHYLVQADLLPALGDSIWDSSAMLSQRSLPGQFLHILIGYVDQPTGIELLTYLLTVVTVGLFAMAAARPSRESHNPAIAVAVLVLAPVLFAGGSEPAQASHKIYSPYVERGEIELELRAHTTFDNDPDKDSKEKYKVEAGYGVTDWWATAVIAEIEEDAAGDLEHEATAWENIFQLTEQGEYWLDAGLYFEYEFARESDASDKAEVKLLLEKNIGKYVNTANIIFAREVGSNASGGTEFEYAWRTKYLLHKQYEPGIEVYGSLGKASDWVPSDEQDHRIGPVLSGVLSSSPHSKWVYEVGYLAGISDAAPRGTFKFVIEYEFR